MHIDELQPAAQLYKTLSPKISSKCVHAFVVCSFVSSEAWMANVAEREP
jgi:hypothetical protein